MRRMAFLFCALSLAIATCSCRNTPVDMQKHLQEQLITARPGAVIEVPEGKYHFDRTLSLTVDKVTLRGKGMDKTVLSFAGQKEGAQGLLTKANDFTIEDIGIEDSAGDALTVQGGTNIIIRRVRAEWTRGANAGNGPYATWNIRKDPELWRLVDSLCRCDRTDSAREGWHEERCARSLSQTQNSGPRREEAT